MITYLPESAETVRGAALERLIRVAQALQRVRFGLTVEDLVGELEEVSGRRWSSRTVHRDLGLLQRVGVVEYRDGRARWVGEGGFFEQPATAWGLARDASTRSLEQSA